MEHNMNDPSQEEIEMDLALARKAFMAHPELAGELQKAREDMASGHFVTLEELIASCQT